MSDLKFNARNGLSVGTDNISVVDNTGNITVGNITMTTIGFDLANNRIFNVASPSTSVDVATKEYVDTAAAGLNVHPAADYFAYTSEAQILIATYVNGTADANSGLGIGANLVANVSDTTTLTVDGNVVVLGERVLVNSFTGNSIQNGIYTLTNSSNPWILTRSSDANNSIAKQMISGDLIYITEGSMYAGTSWVQSAVGTGPGESIIIGTDAVLYTQFAGPGSLTGTTNEIDIIGTNFSLSPTIILPGTINKITLTEPAMLATLTLANNTIIVGPSISDTLVGRTTTDTLTNKTLSNATITGGSINNTVIGNVTPSTGTFTTVNKVAITAPATIANLVLIDGTTVTGPATTDTIVGRATTDTLTNKSVVLRVSSQADAASITPNIDSYDEYVQSAQAQALVINNPTGAPTDGQCLLIRIKDNGTARALSFGTNYVAYGSSLSSTTTISKTLLVMSVYNSSTTKWMVMPSIQEQ